eukprot:COSAG03_NODE_16791_length_392_cov_0.880546_1_plen_51_part_10
MAWPRTASKNCSCSLNCLVDNNLLLQQVQACELGNPATWIQGVLYQVKKAK